MSISNTVSQTDLMYFKEEILSNIRQLENKVNEKIEVADKNIDLKVAPYDLKIDNLASKITNLSNLISVDNSTNDRVQKLEQFKAKVEDSINIHESKINQNARDITNACYKYDRIMLENFMIPGIIGNGCKYANMKSYIQASLNQFSDLNAYKDKQIIDLKVYKDKLESMIKFFSSQIEGVKQNFLDYCKKAVEETEKNFEERCKGTDERVESMRLENGKYAIDLKTKTEELGISWEKIQHIKEEIYSRLDDEIKNFQSMNDHTVSTMDDYKKEFKLIKKKFTELSEFIKDVRFRRNLGGDVKQKELREMARKIDFDKKQKYDDSDDDEEDKKSVMSANLIDKKRAQISPSQDKRPQQSLSPIRTNAGRVRRMSVMPQKIGIDGLGGLAGMLKREQTKKKTNNILNGSKEKRNSKITLYKMPSQSSEESEKKKPTEKVDNTGGFNINLQNATNHKITISTVNELNTISKNDFEITGNPVTKTEEAPKKEENVITTETQIQVNGNEKNEETIENKEEVEETPREVLNKVGKDEEEIDEKEIEKEVEKKEKEENEREESDKEKDDDSKHIAFTSRSRVTEKSFEDSATTRNIKSFPFSDQVVTASEGIEILPKQNTFNSNEESQKSSTRQMKPAKKIHISILNNDNVKQAGIKNISLNQNLSQNQIQKKILSPSQRNVFLLNQKNKTNINASLIPELIERITKTDRKIASIERETRARLDDIIHQINSLVILKRVAPQKAYRTNYDGFRVANVTDANTIQAELGASRSGKSLSPLTIKGLSQRTNTNARKYKKKAPIKVECDNNLKSSTIGFNGFNTGSVMFGGGNSTKEGKNHFSSLSLLISNQPKFAPRDDSNILLSNIEPYLIRQFDQQEEEMNY